MTSFKCHRLVAIFLTALLPMLSWNGGRADTFSQWVHPGADGKLIYQTTPAGDRILDFSYAGYMGGGVALPDVPVKVTVTPSGSDDTMAIQSAINQVAALPLAVAFAAQFCSRPVLSPAPTLW